MKLDETGVGHADPCVDFSERWKRGLTGLSGSARIASVESAAEMDYPPGIVQKLSV
jgi:hypothetical protein